MKKEYCVPVMDVSVLPSVDLLTWSGDPQMPFVPFNGGNGTEDDFIA